MGYLSIILPTFVTEAGLEEGSQGMLRGGAALLPVAAVSQQRCLPLKRPQRLFTSMDFSKVFSRKFSESSMP